MDSLQQKKIDRFRMLKLLYEVYADEAPGTSVEIRSMTDDLQMTEDQVWATFQYLENERLAESEGLGHTGGISHGEWPVSTTAASPGSGNRAGATTATCTRERPA
jgi:hypothetical protein